jgi:hypothetical protein
LKSVNEEMQSTNEELSTVNAERLPEQEALSGRIPPQTGRCHQK